MPWQANPDEETTDWRAVCGRTGGWPWATRTVRRAGRARALLDPYHLAFKSTMDSRLRGNDGWEGPAFRVIVL